MEKSFHKLSSSQRFHCLQTQDMDQDENCVFLHLQEAKVEGENVEHKGLTYQLPSHVLSILVTHHLAEEQ